MPLDEAMAHNIAPGSTAGLPGLVLSAGLTTGGLPVALANRNCPDSAYLGEETGPKHRGSFRDLPRLVQGHGGANESPQRLLVYFLALVEVDGTPGVALKARVEEARRILELRPFGESHLHDALVGLARADHSVVRPHRNPSPLPLLYDLGIGFLLACLRPALLHDRCSFYDLIDLHVELGKMSRIHDEVDPGDLVALDREQERRPNLTAHCPYRPCLAVDDRGQGSGRTTLEGVRYHRCAASLWSQERRSVPPVRGGRAYGQIIPSQHDVG